MKIQEVLEDITMRETMFPSPKTSYMEANTQKDEETCGTHRKNTLGYLKHDPCAPSTDHASQV